ncbi:MAG TPA: hypothetical protein VK184_20520 [Nostocaceae cyanobacterium]|nr:hypothetical protein [Nostocaceae cyanobacterium]
MSYHRYVANQQQEFKELNVMLTSFIGNTHQAAEGACLSVSTDSLPNREKVKLLLIGSPTGVNSIILHLYKLGFASVGEWSSPQPTNNQGEIMRILVKHIVTQ